MDWTWIAVGAIVLGVVVGIVAITRIGINMDRRPRKPNGIQRAKGDYHAPEPPEGRYWG